MSRTQAALSSSVPELVRRIGWLIVLRWIASSCLGLTIAISRSVFRTPLPLLPLLVCTLLLVVANVGYELYFARRFFAPGVQPSPRRLNGFVNLQISVDLLLLTTLLNFSGGLENPFSLFYVFHMVIASILLPKRQAYLQATLAVSLFTALAVVQLLGWLGHVHLFPAVPELFTPAGHSWVLGAVFAFTATVYITVYMTSTIAVALRRREQELESAVRRVESANRLLEKKDREKSRYVQIVSHDIKNHLGAVQGCLRVVLDGLTGIVAEKPAAMIGRAEARSWELLRFADELFYLSTLRAEDCLRKSPVALGEVARTAVAKLAPELRARGLEVEVQDLSGQAILRADPDVLARLFEQLLDNALRNTLKGGMIRLRLGCAKDGRAVEVLIGDTGLGISEQDLPHVFDDFFSPAVPESGATGRTRMGLAIARQIVEMHGGAIVAESEPGRGSTFRFTLPLESP